MNIQAYPPEVYLARAEEMLETNNQNIGRIPKSGKPDLFHPVHALSMRTETERPYFSAWHWTNFSLDEKVLLLCFIAAAWEDLR